MKTKNEIKNEDIILMNMIISKYEQFKYYYKNLDICRNTIENSKQQEKELEKDFIYDLSFNESSFQDNEEIDGYVWIETKNYKYIFNKGFDISEFNKENVYYVNENRYYEILGYYYQDDFDLFFEIFSEYIRYNIDVMNVYNGEYNKERSEYYMDGEKNRFINPIKHNMKLLEYMYPIYKK